MAKKKVGVLLLNLGTPDEATPKAVRQYLKEFLWDRRVVDLSRGLWWLILNGIILRFRPRRVAKLYQSVWTPEGSPMRSILNLQARKLQEWFDNTSPTPTVRAAMTYGNPSTSAVLKQMIDEGYERIIALPLFPQYSATTTGAAFDAVARTLMEQRNIPELVFIRDYYQHSLYIEAMKSLIEEHWASQGRSEHLVFSFHGIPRRYYEMGDPYPDHCNETASMIANALGLQSNQWTLAYQSRFGREEWMKPYLDEKLVALSAQGIKSIDVISPSFSADCLETLEELSVELKQVFLGAGGQTYHYIPALNSRDDHIRLMGNLIAERL